MSVGDRLRFLVLRRDHYRCRYCGAQAPAAELEVDHVVPRSRGGPDTLANLVTACIPCNRGKSNLPVLVTARPPLSHAEIIEAYEDWGVVAWLTDQDPEWATGNAYGGLAV